jgi:hypothetical protein
MNQTEIIGNNAEESIQQHHYFSSAVYHLKKPEFLSLARTVSKDYINQVKKTTKLDKIHPVYQTDNFFNDERMKPMVDFIANTSWHILRGQGYAMDNFDMTYIEFWCQEHHQYSGHEQHIHGLGSQISGFYFLDVPKEGPKVMFHDPNPAKVYANLPEANVNNATYASVAINYVPEPGSFMFINSWVPHTIGRNASNNPLRFIHFNLGVSYNPPKENNETPVEIV